MTIQAVILAAGQGTRMNSNLPKVLHELGGKPMLAHVVQTATKIAPNSKPIIVFGHGGETVKTSLPDYSVQFVLQAEQSGTAHAVQQTLPHIDDNARVLVLYGDVPLISIDTLNHLIENTPLNGLGIVTAKVPLPRGYGRIKRNDSDAVIGIVEEKDASDDERRINEINSGIYLIPGKKLKAWLPNIQPNNAQGEYYLTDIVPMAVAEGMTIATVQPDYTDEIQGVNDRVQLAHLERFFQRRQAENLMQRGVTIIDPTRIDIRGDVTVGKDVTIDINVVLEGDVTIGDATTIGANTIIKHAVIGQRVSVKANSMIEHSTVGNDCIVGPYARLRPGTELAASAHIGNFVEVKKSRIGEGSKVNHLTYIGDAIIGQRVNVGAGTITCNYDGVNKHQTIIGDDAFIGSCSQLVAPVTVGAGATIGAGSTITQNAPAWKLTLTRPDQHTASSWVRPDKKEPVKE